MSVDHDPSCVFCKIARGVAPALIARDWGDVVAFSPIRPATVGHTLIIPTRHVRDIWDLDSTVSTKLAVRTIEVADAIRRELNVDGLNVIQSNGAAATQTVFHLHVHLVPRYVDDSESLLQWPERDIPEGTTRDAFAGLRKLLEAD